MTFVNITSKNKEENCLFSAQVYLNFSQFLQYHLSCILIKMSYSTSIKQIFSKNVRYKIDLMEWNNKMDLIALSQNSKFFFDV